MTQSVTKYKQKLSFDGLAISGPLAEAITQAGYQRPTPIQASLIPLAIEGHDLIGQARTGTGKTAAFAIPILHHFRVQPPQRPQALVLVPTRELAVQVTAEFCKLTPANTARTAAIYGGTSITSQSRKLRAGIDIVVGTPGRVLDHMRRKTLVTEHIRFVVLDEADRMLDIGFRPDIERILRVCPTQRQTLLLSATLPPTILQLARRYMQKPKLINLSARALAAESIEQFYFSVSEDNKFPLLVKLLERDHPQQAIVFCRTRLGTQRLYRRLCRDTQFDSVQTIHGDLSQASRDSVMQSFRAGETTILVATDVVGRGIDVTQISHIINFDIPRLSDDYVHRVGRTGRMGRDGVAYTFVTALEGAQLSKIEQKINRQLKFDQIDGIPPAVDPDRPAAPGRRSKARYRRAL